jgi:hypothetical protein
MGAAGSPYAAFSRALRSRNLTLALAEARDLPVVNLADALELLLLLIRDKPPERYERASARWLARYCLEVPGVTLSEAMLAASALQTLAAPEERVGALALVVLVRQRRLRDVERCCGGCSASAPLTRARSLEAAIRRRSRACRSLRAWR